MTAYGRQRHPGKIDVLARSNSLTSAILADSPLMLWEGFMSGATDISGNNRNATLGANIVPGISLGNTGVTSYNYPEHKLLLTLFI